MHRNNARDQFLMLLSTSQTLTNLLYMRKNYFYRVIVYAIKNFLILSVFREIVNKKRPLIICMQLFILPNAPLLVYN